MLRNCELLAKICRLKRLQSTLASVPCIEKREYRLNVGKALEYLDHTAANADLRKSLVPLRLFCTPDSGGTLHVARHFYYYEGGIAQRDEAREHQAKMREWQEYLALCRPCVEEQRSDLYVEANVGVGVEGLSSPIISGNFRKTIYEIRKYQLKLGYDIVPTFLDHYRQGLPSKLGADGNDPDSSLCTVLYSDVGSLNEVIEIWRHGNGVEGMTRNRVAARTALAWRRAINEIASLATEFTSTIHRPTSFSNWK